MMKTVSFRSYLADVRDIGGLEMNPRKMMLGCLGWCPGVSAVARFLPDREMSERTMAVSITFTAFVLVLVAAYSGYATMSENQVRKEYAASNVFFDFDIVEVRQENRPVTYRDGEVSFPIYFRDVDEFIRVAHQQDVQILYRVVVPDYWVFYYFESPIYDESYLVYEIEITPPIRRVYPVW